MNVCERKKQKGIKKIVSAAFGGDVCHLYSDESVDDSGCRDHASKSWKRSEGILSERA